MLKKRTRSLDIPEVKRRNQRKREKKAAGVQNSVKSSEFGDFM